MLGFWELLQMLFASKPHDAVDVIIDFVILATNMKAEPIEKINRRVPCREGYFYAIVSKIQRCFGG